MSRTAAMDAPDAPLSASVREPAFQKVLWRKQPFPDNYQNEEFLAQLRRNVGHRDYTVGEAVFAALPLTTHLSAIVTFVGTFVYLHHGLIKPQDMIWLSSGVGMLGYLVWERGMASRKLLRASTFRSAASVLFLLLLVSGVLRTLTLSTAEDSIWSLSTILFVLHFILGDHGTAMTKPDSHASLPSVLSLNAATSAAVVLASRLDSNASAFALVLFAIEWFALFPIMRNEVVRRHPDSKTRPVILTVALCTLTFLVLAPLSLQTAVIYFAVIPVGVTAGVPAVWMYLQQYRNVLSGPWDLGVPRLS